MSFKCLGSCKNPKFLKQCFLNGFSQIETCEYINLENISDFPDTHWMWRKIAKNKNFRNKYPDYFWKFVKNNPKKNWNFDWEYISYIVSAYEVKNYPNFPWSLSTLSRRINWSQSKSRNKFIKKDSDWEAVSNTYHSHSQTFLYKWDFGSITKYAPLDFISKHPELPWDYSKITICVYGYGKTYDRYLLFWDLVAHTPLKNWDWINISDYATWDFIRENPHIPWDYSILSNKTYIDWEYVDDHNNQNWNWYSFSYKKDIPLWFIKKYIATKPFRYEKISNKVDIETLNNYPDLEWNFKWAHIDFYPEFTNNSVYNNPRICWDDIKNNPHLGWNYKYVHQTFKNGNIDWDYIIQRMWYTWDFKWLSEQSNIPLKFLIAYYNYLSTHNYDVEFSIHNNIFKNLCQNVNLSNQDIIDHYKIPWAYSYLEKNMFLKRDQAARIIQNQWLKCRYNPEFRLCHKIQTQNLCDIFDEYKFKYNKYDMEIEPENLAATVIQNAWLSYQHRKQESSQPNEDETQELVISNSKLQILNQEKEKLFYKIQNIILNISLFAEKRRVLDGYRFGVSTISNYKKINSIFKIYKYMDCGIIVEDNKYRYMKDIRKLNKRKIYPFIYKSSYENEYNLFNKIKEKKPDPFHKFSVKNGKLYRYTKYVNKHFILIGKNRKKYNIKIA